MAQGIKLEDILATTRELIPQKLQKEVLLDICEGATNFIPVDPSPSIVLSLEQIPRSVMPDMPGRVIAAAASHQRRLL